VHFSGAASGERPPAACVCALGQAPRLASPEDVLTVKRAHGEPPTNDGVASQHAFSGASAGHMAAAKEIKAPNVISAAAICTVISARPPARIEARLDT